MTTVANPLAHLSTELGELKAAHLYRPLRVMSSANGTRVTVDGRDVISLASNNYLGLNTHPRLVEAAVDAARRYGAGSGAVRTISGTMTLHEELETALAAFKRVEAVLTFQSGLDITPAITHRFPAREHESAFAAARSGDAGKVIMDWTA